LYICPILRVVLNEYQQQLFLSFIHPCPEKRPGKRFSLSLIFTAGEKGKYTKEKNLEYFIHSATITFAGIKMVIAVDTRFLMNDHEEGYGYFLYENFRHIVRSYPEHHFIFIFDRAGDKNFLPEKNVKTVVVNPVARSPLLWKLWYEIRIPAVLKKYKADIFVGCHGICSLTTKIPQCLLLHDLSFLRSASLGKRSHAVFYKRNTQSFLDKAKSVVVLSSHSKKAVTQHYKIDAGKIMIVPPAVKKIFRELTDEEKTEIKWKLTGGKEYFLNSGSIHPRENIISLLKAFSVFKKKQSSNWKLVLTGKLTAEYRDFTESLETYKYRDDVVLTGRLSEDELARVLSSAYAMVYPSLGKDFAAPVLEAMSSSIPVITSGDSSMQEMAGDAALYCDPVDHGGIAEKMILLYKDENLRSLLIEKGKEIAKQYDWNKSSLLLWQGIIKAMG